MDSKKTVPNPEPSLTSRPSRSEIKQCKAILEQISDFLPGTYAQEAQRILEVRGISRSLSQIRDTRAGRNKHLPTILVLEKLANLPPAKKKEHDFGLAEPTN